MSNFGFSETVTTYERYVNLPRPGYLGFALPTGYSAARVCLQKTVELLARVESLVQTVDFGSLGYPLAVDAVEWVIYGGSPGGRSEAHLSGSWFWKFPSAGTSFPGSPLCVSVTTNFVNNCPEPQFNQVQPRPGSLSGIFSQNGAVLRIPPQTETCVEVSFEGRLLEPVFLKFILHGTREDR